MHFFTVDSLRPSADFCKYGQNHIAFAGELDQRLAFRGRERERLSTTTCFPASSASRAISKCVPDGEAIITT